MLTAQNEWPESGSTSFRKFGLRSSFFAMSLHASEATIWSFAPITKSVGIAGSFLETGHFDAAAMGALNVPPNVDSSLAAP